MTHYFFISTPLHFFIATNLAILHEHDTNIAIFIGKSEKTTQQYAKAIHNNTEIFSQHFDLTIEEGKQKFTHRKLCFSQLDHIIASNVPDSIFTGSDRRMEFQYAMHKAQGLNANVEGIYMDDGTVSYLGHKSIHSVFHRYIDPTLKKLVYGFWWKNALTTGSSSWISKAYLAAPNDAHTLLQAKTLVALDPDVFLNDKFIKVNERLIENYDELTLINFEQVNAVLCLPNESFYLKDAAFLQKIKNTVFKHFQPHEIAIKAHPKSNNMTLLAHVFPDSIHLPNSLGMELLLPKLSNNTVIVGDVSTALLTAKWLKPKITVQAFEVNNDMSKQLKRLFHSVGITFLSLEPV